LNSGRDFERRSTTAGFASQLCVKAGFAMMTASTITNPAGLKMFRTENERNTGEEIFIISNILIINIINTQTSQLHIQMYQNNKTTETPDFVSLHNSALQYDNAFQKEQRQDYMSSLPS
jgi:hypothetical protein